VAAKGSAKRNSRPLTIHHVVDAMAPAPATGIPPLATAVIRLLLCYIKPLDVAARAFSIIRFPFIFGVY
jgi:hypothetical protein